MAVDGFMLNVADTPDNARAVTGSIRASSNRFQVAKLLFLKF
jgi:hypothetical protein